MSKSRFGILFAFFILLITGMATAQDTTNTTTDQNTDFNNDVYHQQDPTMQQQSGANEAMVNELRTRLNLREDQVDQISDLVERYRRESATMQSSPQTTDESISVNANTELQNRYNSEIETILDENQRTQFREYSSTWWNSVNSPEGEGTEINRDYHKEGTDIQRDETDTQNEGIDTEGTDVEREETESQIDGTESDTNSDTNSDDTGTESGTDLR